MQPRQQADGRGEGPGVGVQRLLGQRGRRGASGRFGEGERLEGRRGRGGRGRGAPQLLSEAGPGGAGVGEVGCDHPVPLGAADHVADLPVELQQLGADEAQVLARAHQGDGARLAQRLVAEVHVEQRLHLALRAAAEHAAGPLPPGRTTHDRGCEETETEREKILTHRLILIHSHVLGGFSTAVSFAVI